MWRHVASMFFATIGMMPLAEIWYRLPLGLHVHTVLPRAMLHNQPNSGLGGAITLHTLMQPRLPA
jgi:hypothetical protein